MVVVVVCVCVCVCGGGNERREFVIQGGWGGQTNTKL